MTNPADLDRLGILSLGVLPPAYANLSEDSRHLLTAILLESSKTLRATYIHKHYSADTLLALDISGLIQWQSDKFGKPVELALTWQGEEAATAFLKVARIKSKPRKYRT